MNTKTIGIALIAVLAILAGSCSKSPTSPNESGNLITNSSFSSDGQPSLTGWAINDTGLVKVVSNAPQGSNTWSLWTAPAASVFGGGTATTYVTGQSGMGGYTFSCWELNMAGWYYGYVTLAQVRNGKTISIRGIGMGDTVWAAYTLSDTLDLLPTDTICITISTGSAAVWINPSASPQVDSARYGCCFNQVSLVKLK